MNSPFKIYIDRLKGGCAEKIAEVVTSDFLDVKEKELTFPGPVSISGDAYLADGHLVIRLQATAEAWLPCSICNEPTKVPIEVKDFYHTEPLEDLRNPVYNYAEALRESILLAVPLFTECHQGNCPERENVSKYFKPPGKDIFPFANLD